MPLDLAPEIETIVRQYAEREGVSVNELLARTFPPIKPTATGTETAEDDAKARVSALLRQWQQEYGLPPRPDGKVHTSAADLFAQWDAEDATRVPEEVEAERRLRGEIRNAVGASRSDGQVLSLGLPIGQYIVARRNVQHLIRLFNRIKTHERGNE